MQSSRCRPQTTRCRRTFNSGFNSSLGGSRAQARRSFAKCVLYASTQARLASVVEQAEIPHFPLVPRSLQLALDYRGSRAITMRRWGCCPSRFNSSSTTEAVERARDQGSLAALLVLLQLKLDYGGSRALASRPALARRIGATDASTQAQLRRQSELPLDKFQPKPQVRLQLRLGHEGGRTPLRRCSHPP